jgi:3-deoxy-D-manno-octulosonate 8-phosphate phosphatase KdsC-like HAD superfamily phosphatase
MGETIKLMRGNAGIDAVILTKQESVSGIIRCSGFPLEKIAAIGDEVGDLPLLTKQGLGFIGAPANAQSPVKDFIKNKDNGYLSSQEAFFGFADFYNEATKREIKLIISDKDGVLKDGDKTWGSDFAKLAMQMGQKKNPYVVILTGSSYQQNLSFMKEYGLDNRLESNLKIKDYPYLLLAESGAIHINVLTGETRNYVADIQPELLKVLKKEFEPRVKSKIEEKVLPECGLIWSDKYEDQTGKVYHVKDKLSMVTFGVPRYFSDGKPYRKSPESEIFRDGVIGVMVEIAEELKMPYELI